MNKFFKTTDKKIEELGDFKIPAEWWSRPYEYALAIEYLDKKDKILDVGCGIEHPFKEYATTKVKEVVAIDKDPKIRELSHKKIKFIYDDILNLKLKENEEKYDKIFCISTLEHTQTFLVQKLQAMKDALSDKGKIIITCDSPLLRWDKLLEYVEKAGLKLDGKENYSDQEDLIKSDRYNLNCYSMILKK